jgi:hypothetical protein
MFEKSYFEDLQDYLQSSNKDDLDGERLDYYNALYTMIGLNRKYGRDNAVRTFMHPPFNCTRRIARRLYDEAVSLFFECDNISNKAHRNMMFQQLQAAALVVLKTARSAKAMEVYGKLMKQASDIKGLDKPDEEERELPPHKPITVWTLDPEQVGLPSEDRKLLATQIDDIPDISVSDKERLKRESMAKAIDITEILDDTETKTKDID